MAVDSIEVRRERDGSFRYHFRIGEQLVVSRESYPTEAEAIEAGETVRQRTGTWVRPEHSNSG